MTQHPVDPRDPRASTESAEETGLPRRHFLAGGAALVAGGALLGGCATPGTKPPSSLPAAVKATKVEKAAKPAGKATTGGATKKGHIAAYRTLGRIGFSVSEISLGCGRISDPNLVRYAYDRGVNYFDTAEGYGNGDSERMIGAAMPHLSRDKIFITTKLKVKASDTERTLLDRFARCLARLKTPYVDALYSHSVTDVAMVKNAAFHAALKRLKADGKVKHIGISSHGPRGKKGDSMDRVLLAAIDDGRFDLMLLVYNFMNSAPGGQVLAAAQKKGVGTTLMKTSPARLVVAPYDPADPSDEHTRMIGLFMKKGLSRPKAVAELQTRLARQRAQIKKHKATIDAFVAKHGIKSEQTLRQKSVQWTLLNPHVATVCVSMNDFETMDSFIPLAGTKLAQGDARMLQDWAAAFSTDYCRHGCSECTGSCPHGVPINTILRYAYYAEQGSERHAMRKYAALGAMPSDPCLDCDAPCEPACPHGLAVQANLLTAHGRLSLT